MLTLILDESAVKVVEILLENGAEPNYVAPEKSPLHHAASRGFSKCVFALIKYGATLDAK
jgi:ankyrin repeat protein